MIPVNHLHITWHFCHGLNSFSGTSVNSEVFDTHKMLHFVSVDKLKLYKTGILTLLILAMDADNVI